MNDKDEPIIAVIKAKNKRSHHHCMMCDNYCEMVAMVTVRLHGDLYEVCLCPQCVEIIQKAFKEEGSKNEQTS